MALDYTNVVDPIALKEILWPEVAFYDKQVEVIYSVLHNYVTVVPAGNMLGKDFIAGFIAVWYFLAYKEVRVVTTSIRDDHLRVLWGEIGRFIQSSAIPLDVRKGGPLVINHREIRKYIGDEMDKISYLLGMVSEKGEGMAGHHAANTLLICDEASGIDDMVITQGETWAKRILLIGNPNPCNNYFYKWVEEGDILIPMVHI